MEDEIETALENEETVEAEGEVSEEELLESGNEGESNEEDEGDEDVVQIGNEEPPASEEEQAAPKWVKELREQQKALKRENAELKAKLGTGQPAAKTKPTLPAKPTLASCEYDEEKYQADTDAWHAKKREVEAFEADQNAALDAQKKRAQTLDEHYAATRKALKVSDFQDAESDAAAALSEVQQALIKSGADNPALIVYALGKNPKKLADLASIKDPVKFAVAVGKLETEVKVTKRTSTKPAPESTVRGGSGSAPASSATLERLEAQAAKTGDRSKVIAYKRQLKAAGK